MWIIQILFWASFITFLFGAQRTIALLNLHSDYSAGCIFVPFATLLKIIVFMVRNIFLTS